MSLVPKRRVFVSYHHKGDQAYYDSFSKTFDDAYDIVRDNSLDRQIDSDNVDYVMRIIRENYLTGSSCTIVLCGLNTPYRKYVDWEIDATLQKEGGLIGVKLPTLRVVDGGCTKPARLQDNIDSGYAKWVWLEYLYDNPGELSRLIEEAKYSDKRLIRNDRARRLRNG